MKNIKTKTLNTLKKLLTKIIFMLGVVALIGLTIALPFYQLGKAQGAKEAQAQIELETLRTQVKK